MKYNGKEYYSQGDIYAAIEDQNKLLKEENKKLKSEIRRITSQRDNLKGISDNLVDENRYLEEENKNLKEEVEVWKNANKILRMHDAKMEYENKKLKEDIEIINKFECVDLEVASERIKQLEEQLDNKEKLNKSYREEIDKLKIDLKLYENAYGHMFE